jgi:hypothetical protein
VYCDVMRPVDQLCVVGNVYCVAFALQEIDRRLLFHLRAIVARSESSTRTRGWVHGL